MIRSELGPWICGPMQVLTVREILAYNVEANVSARVDLEDLCFSALTYELHEASKLEVRAAQL